MRQELAECPSIRRDCAFDVNAYSVTGATYNQCIKSATKRCPSLSTHLGRVISGVEYRHRESETVVITKVVDKRGGRMKERAVVRPGQKGTRVSSRSRMDPGCMPVPLAVSRVTWGPRWACLRVGHATSFATTSRKRQPDRPTL